LFVRTLLAPRSTTRRSLKPPESSHPDVVVAAVGHGSSMPVSAPTARVPLRQPMLPMACCCHVLTPWLSGQWVCANRCLIAHCLQALTRTTIPSSLRMSGAHTLIRMCGTFEPPPSTTRRSCVMCLSLYLLFQLFGGRVRISSVVNVLCYCCGR
jgi:hypothetical protein